MTIPEQIVQMLDTLPESLQKQVLEYLETLTGNTTQETEDLSIVDQYIAAALQQAVYEWLPDDRLFFGKIPGLQGLWASAETESACIDALRDRLTTWIEIHQEQSDPLPIMGGIELPLNAIEEAA
jgi:predicted RNase H-like HicB family nuclease